MLKNIANIWDKYHHHHHHHHHHHVITVQGILNKDIWNDKALQLNIHLRFLWGAVDLNIELRKVLNGAVFR